MNSDRRSFLRKNLFVGGSLLLANSLNAVAGVAKSMNTLGVNQLQLNIMYTNDLKGMVDAAYRDFGGLRQLYNTIDSEEVSSLLFDAGGFLNPKRSIDQQLKGIDIMNKINYHGVNISAADLTHGLDNFCEILPYINFQLISCNYHFEAATLRKAVKPYQILNYGKYKVGVTGVGELISMKGLTVSNPQTSLKRISSILKNKHNCDIVVCLAHLGFDEDKKINNKILAQTSTGVDLVVGGNAKVGKSRLWVVKNALKNDVLLSHNHHQGLSTARLTIAYNSLKEKTGLNLVSRVPGLKDNKNMNALLLETNS